MNKNKSQTENTKVIVILGPTSSGKSDLAVDLAQKINGEIISADSRQIYCDLNLGTGKVPGYWQKNKDQEIYFYREIPHHLLDFEDPRRHLQDENRYNVSNFQKDALRLIKQISARQKIPIVCGGTGFWIQALIDQPVFPAIKPNQNFRQQLSQKTTEELFVLLKNKDARYARKIDSHNRQRLIRALEIINTLGKMPAPRKKPPRHLDFLQIGLDWPREKLAQKIKKRLQSRWTEGMIEEVKNIKKKYQMTWEDIQKFGLAYYWIPLYLQKKESLSAKNNSDKPPLNKQDLLEKIFLAEKNYAKRQRTWFRRDQRIIWENDFNKILSLVNNFLSSQKQPKVTRASSEK